LARQLTDVGNVRSKVADLLPRNPFRESCFCKGCVLPVVDTLTTKFLADEFGAPPEAVRHALRCEGFATQLYTCDASQVGFSSHSRSNSYHPGDKSGRRETSRRSPDFCIRYRDKLRMVGELKYVESYRPSDVQKLVHELRDYLSIAGEPTSDWGHDFGFGLFYVYGGESPRAASISHDYWDSDRILISTFIPT
jgi:hypothetical protein